MSNHYILKGQNVKGYYAKSDNCVKIILNTLRCISKKTLRKTAFYIHRQLSIKKNILKSDTDCRHSMTDTCTKFDISVKTSKFKLFITKLKWNLVCRLLSHHFLQQCFQHDFESDE